MNDTVRSDERVHTTCLIILTVIASGAALYFLRPVVVPFLLALIVFYSLLPVINWQRSRLGLPRGLAIVGAVLAALGLLIVAGVLLAAFIVKLHEHLPIFSEQFRLLTERFHGSLDLSRIGIDHDGPLLRLPESATRRLLTSVLSGAAEIAADGILVVLFVIFIFIGGTAVKTPPSPLRAEIETAVHAYIVNMVGLSAITGLLVGGMLGLLGVSFALEFGVLAFLLSFIPNVGAMIATVLPLPVVILSPELGPFTRIMAIAGPAAIQIFIGSLIMPRMMGKSQDLHPVAVLLAMAFFGSIWGLLGAVLAVPLTGVLRIAFSHSEATRPMAAWLAGDLKGSPVKVEPVS